jgi:hypothetical protein
MLHINLREEKVGHEICYPRSKIQCITADNAKWQNICEPTFYAVKQRKITNISRYGLFCVSRQTSAEVTRTRQKYKVSTWTIHHQILWENTHYMPSKSRIASVTANIVSNIIQNTLCNNVPHFLKIAKNLLTLNGFSRSLLNQVKRWKKMEYRQWKEAHVKHTTLYSIILIMFPVPKFHLT